MNVRYLFFLLFLTTILPGCKQHQPEPLFPIEKEGKIGFVNSKGTVVIQPQFRSAGLFSEGLAPVRMDGTYGYIDATGKWVIPPQFDYALPFSEGFAIVYKEAEPFYINRKGEKAFNIHFTVAQHFEHGRAVIKTTTGKYGVIDRNGRLIIDTVFAAIGPFKEGLAIVEGMGSEQKQRADEPLRIGVIDSTGKFIIPYLKYRSIQDLTDGYFYAESFDKNWDTLFATSAQIHFLDKKGNVVLAQSMKNHSYAISDVHDGLVRMLLYKRPIKEDSWDSDDDYTAYADLKGNLVINDTAFSSGTDFYDNRAFVEIQEGKWERYYRMINTKGAFISNQKFERINEPGFSNGLAIVQMETGRGWQYGVVDTNANFIIKPQFDEIERIENYFVCQAVSQSGSQLYSLFTTKGVLIAKNVMSGFDREGFRDSLLQCVMGDKLAYLNTSGKIIWKQSTVQKPSVTNLNIDYMNRGYFYATSVPDANDPGGFGGSGNAAHNITAKQSFPSGKMSVVVCPDSVTNFQEQYNGMKVFIANSTSVPVQFDASDSRLYMKVQAKNKKGEWADIEYLPSSWCGNSYHTLTLQPRQYWNFTTPKYEGDFKTKLRVQLTYLDPKEATKPRRERKELTIYSNEYTGSVNPGQFWRKPGYYATNLMDPYLE